MTFNLKKQWHSPKDFSFHKTLGASLSFPDVSYVTQILDQGELPDCTSFDACSTRTSKTGINYDPNQYWTDEKAVWGDPNAQECDLRTQMATGVLKGFCPLQSTVHQDLPACYYSITQVPGLDLFDSIRSAITTIGGPICIGVGWYNEWNTGNQGIVPNIQNSLLGGHSVKGAGIKTINGTPYVIVQNSWGVNAPGSDNGLYYFSREIVNNNFSGYGIMVWADSLNEEVQRLGLLSALYQNLINLLSRVGNKLGFH